ncbi:MAG TPA: trypsin-like serine protease [Deltaproteobacteria bacterium]|nr:trypsin-like serine protease [Deltaproteobacteria bacterium]
MGLFALLFTTPVLAQDTRPADMEASDPRGSEQDRWLGLAEGQRAQGIINGSPAGIDEWPQTGGMLVGATATVAGLEPITGRLLMCSSTLIAPDVVLTAAHCVDLDGLLDVAAQQGFTIETLDDLQIVFSRETDLARYELGASIYGNLPDWPEDAAFSTEWVAHEGFDLFTLQVGLAENDDIGLIFLDEPLLDAPFATLPTPEEADQIVEGADVVIVGWGQQEQDPLPGTVGTKQVAESYISALADYEIKVGEVYEDGRKCHGDSGGPSFMQVQTESAEPWRLIGVTSHAWDATTDCRVTGGVDTRVDHHLEWIDAQMRAACEDGTRSWCDEPGILPPPDASGAFPWDQLASMDLEGEDSKKGCGCSTPAPASAGPGALLLLTILARRRR